jgi:hypothetical protein
MRRAALTAASAIAFAVAACGAFKGETVDAEDDAGTDATLVEDANASADAMIDAGVRDVAVDSPDAGSEVRDAGCTVDASGLGEGGTMTAHQATIVPKIDGDLSEWACVPFFHLSAKNAYVEKSTTISGDFALQWTSTTLYFAMRVDNAGVAPKGGNATDPFLNDSVELYLAQDDAPTGAYRTHDHHYIIDYKNLLRDYDPGRVTPPAADIQAKAVVSGTKYVVEMAVSAAALGHATFTPMKMAWDMELNQSDGTQQLGILVYFEPSGASTVNSTCGAVPEPSCNTHLFAQLVLVP